MYINFGNLLFLNYCHLSRSIFMFLVTSVSYACLFIVEDGIPRIYTTSRDLPLKTVLECIHYISQGTVSHGVSCSGLKNNMARRHGQEWWLLRETLSH
jgi:hypothetical protein